LVFGSFVAIKPTQLFIAVGRFLTLPESVSVLLHNSHVSIAFGRRECRYVVLCGIDFLFSIGCWIFIYFTCGV